MFPLQDTIPSRSVPVVTWTLIVINVLVFLLETSMGEVQLERFLQTFGVVPVRFLESFSLAQVFTVFTSMFLHGGWAHLIGNMWFLHIFGDNVEDRMGAFNYLLFYLIAGTCAAVVQIEISASSATPMIGASGAISGVLGAYWVLFPHSRVITMVPIFFVPQFFEIPAVFFLGLWFTTEFFSGFFSLAGAAADEVGGGVAFWAHVGGFAVGMLTAWLFARGVKERTRYPDEYFPW
jgi:membrane associated rhomboid family serine protease